MSDIVVNYFQKTPHKDFQNTMGICLDTERNGNDSDENDEADDGGPWISETTKNLNLSDEATQGQFPTRNDGYVKFQPPDVPVIFVLGGPGSGKVTHCDNLADEKRGVIHINMSDLLQQYIMSDGDGTKNFSDLPSKTVTEVLMLEMKMSPVAKVYLISGYPRSMRDVVEYGQKIKTVNGVIMIVWRQNMLERQIEYGAKLGHVVLSLARLELKHFFTNVSPVADYYDQREMLTTINGERNPSEVYNDFRATVLKIISNSEIREPIEYFKRADNNIPKTEMANHVIPNGNIPKPPIHNRSTTNKIIPPSSPITTTITVASVYKSPVNDYPKVIFIIGGPGSNKSTLCRKVLGLAPHWKHISMGSLFRSKATSNELSSDESKKLKDTITVGELVNNEIVEDVLDEQMLRYINSDGIILEGYPRNLNQLHNFEKKFKQHPKMILLDCSKLQLGRGRWDDSVSAFRKRLEIFRKETLPLLKTMDEGHRLIMVDGDTETAEVEEAFTKSIMKLIQELEKNENTSASDVVEENQKEEPIRKVTMNGFGPPKSKKIPVKPSSNVKRNFSNSKPK